MDSDWEARNYKKFKEVFMSNLKGTTFTETFLAVTPLLFSVFLSTVINIPCQTVNIINFCIDFFIIVFVSILSCTVLSNYIPIVVVTLCVISVTTVFYHIRFQPKTNFNRGWKDVWVSRINVVKNPFITNFRASTSVLTAICILAVDFRVFPRKFAKTETFGYGLMDTGVGLYCISNAIVSPEVIYYGLNTYRSPTLLQSINKSLKNCIPLLILAGIRCFTIKQIDYQVHVSEYGVHWNFFVTLAVTKLLSTIVTTLCGVRYSVLLSFIIIGIHEFILRTGIQDWALGHDPRDTYLEANREGIVSSLGYVALYLAGVSLGYMLRCTKATFREKFITDLKLISLAVILWTCVALTHYHLPISRRLANIGYFLWLLTFSITTLAAFLTIELVIHVMYIKSNKAFVNETYVPVLLEAVNYNGLAFFLLANLGTGAVNLYYRTLFIGPTPCVVIVTIYMFVVCMCTYILYRKGLKLKW